MREHLAPVRTTALGLLLVAVSCPRAGLEPCNVDDDCNRRTLCRDGLCTPIGDVDAGPGADDGGPGDGGPGDGDGGPGDGGPGDGGPGGEGEGGEGEGDAGEGEGDAGEGEGEGEGEGDGNRAPSAQPAFARLRSGEGAPIVVLASDPDGDAIHFEMVTPPQHGTASLAEGVVYTSDAGYTGDDVFTLRAVDDHGLAGDAADIQVRVVPSNWLDLNLASRVRLDVLGVSGVTAPVDAVAQVRIGNDVVGAAEVEALRTSAVFTADNQTSLAAEIDHEEAAAVVYWVHVPGLDARLNAGAQALFVYTEGSPQVPPPLSTATWASYTGVWHLDHTLADAARNHVQALALNQAVAAENTCTAGECFAFDGAGDAVVLGTDVDDVAGVAGATLSATIRVRSVPVTNGQIVSFSTSNPNDGRASMSVSSSFSLQGAVRFDDATLQSAVSAPFDPTVEHQVDAVFDALNGNVVVYVDGVASGSLDAPPGPAFFMSPNGRAVVGIDEDLSSDPYDGFIDEVRVAPAIRDANFVAVDAASRAGRLVRAGAVER